MAFKKAAIVCLLASLGLCVRLGLAEDQVPTQSASFTQITTFSLPAMSTAFECFQMPSFNSLPTSLSPQDLPSAYRNVPISVPVIVMPNTDYQDRISQIVQSRNNAFSQGRFIAQEEKEMKFKRIVDASNLVLSSPAQEKSE